MNASELPQEIRGVLIPVRGTRLLLPNATVSEVITFSNPAPIADAPRWLLGRVGWRGWHVPLVAFSMLAGLESERGALGSRVTILKIFGGNPRMPFLALVTQGFPRLTTVRPDLLETVDPADELPAGVWSRVRVGDELAVIPDLEALEERVQSALQEAASA